MWELVKGTVRVNSSDPPCKDGNSRFKNVAFKYKYELEYQCYNFVNGFFLTVGFLQTSLPSLHDAHLKLRLQSFYNNILRATQMRKHYVLLRAISRNVIAIGNPSSRPSYWSETLWRPMQIQITQFLCISEHPVYLCVRFLPEYRIRM